MSPTAITCSRTECLNNKKTKCTAIGVEWCRGRCLAFIGSRDGMRSDVDPMERKNGSMTNKQVRRT